MKRVSYLIISVLVLGSLSGCSTPNDQSITSSTPYSSKEAISRGDIVYRDKWYNFENFERFENNLRNKTAARVRITGYTDEGDPIFKDLNYDGKVISYTYDNSNDGFGGSNKGIRTDTCTKVTSEKNAQGDMDYTISGCSKNDSEINYFLLHINKE